MEQEKQEEVISEDAKAVMDELKKQVEEVKEEAQPAQKQEDIKALSINEKYALILTNVKQDGLNFFARIDPNTFGLPTRDPLNLIWINILTAWNLASTVLNQFERNMIAAQQATTKEETNQDDQKEKEKEELNNHEEITGTTKEESQSKEVETSTNTKT